jgi:hypothetical protein
MIQVRSMKFWRSIRAWAHGLVLLPCSRALASRDSLAQRSRTCFGSLDRWAWAWATSRIRSSS